MSDHRLFEITKSLEKLKVSLTRGLAEAQSEIENLREDLKKNNEQEKLQDLENELKKYAGLYHWHGVLFDDFLENFDSMIVKIACEDKIQKLKSALSAKEVTIKNQEAKINDLQQYINEFVESKDKAN